MKYKAVLFDMDGVVIDSEKVYKDCWKTIGAKVGISNKDMGDLFDLCLGMSEQDELEVFKQKLGWSYVNYFMFKKLVEKQKPSGTPKVKQGVEKLLENLQKEGYIIALVSSNTIQNIEYNLFSTGLFKYFDHIISGEEVKHSKPNPEIYQLALTRMGLKPMDCLVLEDSPNGIKSAVSAGIDAYMIEDTICCSKELQKLVVGYHNSFIYVEQILRGNVNV